MADGVGLSIGATNLAAVVVGRAAVTRSPVLTLFPHRPPEVGVPSENPNLNERGLIITDFVDRVGDPVGIVASDGSTHRGEVLLADALRAMRYAVVRGGPPTDPVAVTYPAHWRPTSVDALRNALATVPEFSGAKSQDVAAAVVSDAAAALTALQDDPGVPTRGVIALCDFGGTGTSITLADAANGFQPIGATVRHADLSGDLIDQALLTHVINDLSAAGSVDLTSTSAIGSLTRLRGQCRAAKERLSTTTVTSLAAELPGHSSEVRLTRTELEDAVRQPLTEFVAVVQETLERAGIRQGDLVAVATAGGGARIPSLTTTLSESFRVPVITTPQPELTAAIGGGLTAVRGTVDEGMTSMAAAAPAAAAAAAAAVAPEPDDMAQSSTYRALAWSDADDVPDVAATDPYDYDDPGADAAAGATGARPQLQFGEYDTDDDQIAAVPWYRRPAFAVAAGAVAVLAALALAILFVVRDDDNPTPATTTTPTSSTTEAPAPSSAAPPPAEEPAPEPEAPQTQTQTYTEAPPPPPPATEAPPPPPPTTEAPPPATTEPPPPPTTEAPPTTQPPLIPTIPPIPTIPGLPPFIPQPGQGGTP